jgi:hypothetical protein
MAKNFENGRMVNVNRMGRLRSNGTLERVAPDQERVAYLGRHPELRDGVMMSANNIKAYLEAVAKQERTARWHKIFGAKKTVASATILSFNGD